MYKNTSNLRNILKFQKNYGTLIGEIAHKGCVDVHKQLMSIDKERAFQDQWKARNNTIQVVALKADAFQGKGRRVFSLGKPFRRSFYFLIQSEKNYEY